jgi:hypothetical protein
MIDLVALERMAREEYADIVMDAYRHLSMLLLSVSRSQIAVEPMESCRAAFILQMPGKGKVCFPGPSALSRGLTTGA